MDGKQIRETMIIICIKQYFEAGFLKFLINPANVQPCEEN